MRVIVKETENEGLASFLGKSLTVYCGIYIYSGKLVGLNESCLKLEGAKLVLETGPLGDAKWGIAHSFPREGTWYVMLQAIESFGALKD